MANLMDAITSSISASLSPDAAVTRDYIAKITLEKAEDVAERQLATIEKIQAKLDSLPANAAPEVRAAYAKLLARYK